MSKENNLTDFLTDVASAIKDKRGIGSVNAQNFSTEIRAIEPLFDTINITSNGKVDVKNYRNASVLVETEDYAKLKNYLENAPESFEVPYGFTKIAPLSFYSGTTKYLTFAGPELITEVGANGCAYTGASNLAWGDLRYMGELILPNCTKIGSGAFSGRFFKKIQLDKIEEIPNNAFYIGTYQNGKQFECEINLPNCTKIGNSAFSGICAYSTYDKDDPNIKVNIPECIEIGAQAFQYNRIGEFYAPKITSIPNNCFSSQASGGGIIFPFHIPENVVEIGNHAFAYNQIPEVYINSKCEKIGANAFSPCSQLTKIELNEGLKELNSTSISAKITYIKIPSTVEKMNGSSVISTTAGNGSLIIEFAGSVPPIFSYSSPFVLTHLKAIYVPLGTSQTYKTTTNLTQYADLITEPNNVIFNIPSALINNETITYSLDGGKTYQQFTNTTLALERVATIKLKSTSADTTILVGTTSGGSDIGTISNSEITYATIGDVNIYLTIQ